jgi:CxxC-x17-CxxC domain-containing protein
MSQKRKFEVKCTDCGKSTTVPFNPTKGKPVYCKTCFMKHRSKQQESFSMNSRFNMKNAWATRRGKNKEERKEEVHRSVFRKL